MPRSLGMYPLRIREDCCIIIRVICIDTWCFADRGNSHCPGAKAESGRMACLI